MTTQLCPNCGLENPETALKCNCGYRFSSKELAESFYPLTAQAVFVLCARAINRVFQILSRHEGVYEDDIVVELIKHCISQVILSNFSEKPDDVIKNFVKQHPVKSSSSSFTHSVNPREKLARVLFKLAGTGIMCEMDHVGFHRETSIDKPFLRLLMKTRIRSNKEVSMNKLGEDLNHLFNSWILMCDEDRKFDFESAFLSDLVLIKQIAEKEGWTKETPVKPDILGPLWKRSDKLSKKIKSLVEQQIQKLASLETESIAREVKSCLSFFSIENVIQENFSIENVIQEKAEKGFSDMCPHSDYLSPAESESDFGISITVMPCSLPDAGKYFLREYPSLGFYGFMLEALDSSVGCSADKFRGKKGVIFIVACFSQPSFLYSVNLAISPISKEFGDIIPLVLPHELVPTDLQSDRKYQI